MFDTTFTPGIAPAATKARLEAGNFDNVWPSEKTREKKRATLNKAEKIFRAYGFATPDEMPSCSAEVEFFYDRHLKGGDFPRSSSLKSIGQAKRWMKDYRVIIDVVTGAREARENLHQREDDWAELLAHLRGQRGARQVFGKYEMLPVVSLVTECRLRGIPCAALTAATIHDFAAELPQKTIAAVVKAIVRLSSLRDVGAVPPDLLPNVSPDELSGLFKPAHRVVPDLNHEFASLMEAYVAERAAGRSVEMFGTEERTVETAELGASRIKNIRVALRWLWHGLVVLGVVSSSTPFDKAKITRPALLSDLVGACASGLLGPICDPQTRRTHTLIVQSFLTWLDPDFSRKIPERFFQSLHLRPAPEETEDRIKKQKACLNFIQNEELQRRFFLMPRVFFDEARPLIDRFHSMSRPEGNTISKEQNRALELAIMAALTSINTVFPARLDTLMKLQIFGPNKHIFFPEDEKRRDTVVLEIPGNIVKSGRFALGVPIQSSKMRNSRKILRWYIDEVHPLVLKYKHKRNNLRRPELLFTGLHIDTVRSYWKCHTEDLELGLTPHMTRHFCASLLLASGVPLEDIAELLCHGVQVTERNYAFVARNLVIQSVMDAQAEIYRKLEI